MAGETGELSTHTNGTVIQAIGLAKHFPGAKAVDGVSLEVRAGETVCIIGPNGAGKTTLLYLLGGLILPSAGHATVFGLHRWRDGFEIRKRTTFLPANPVFGECLTPYDFLRFMAQVYGMPKAAFQEKVHRLADEMSMKPHLDKGWASLSLGMQKKTGLIGAFLPEVSLRFLDEPFAGGIDPLAMERLFEWMGAAKSRGETTVFSTQMLEQAETAADRILVLDSGSITHAGTPSELIAKAGVDAASPRALAKAFLALTGPPKEEK